MRPFAKLIEPSYALLRIVAGLLLAFAGAQKLFGIYMDFRPEFGSQIWIGAVIELVCGTAIALGLLTPWAAFLASGTMLVAYAQFHWKFAFDKNFFPGVNQGMPALLLCLVFLHVCARGSGPFALDALLSRRKRDHDPRPAPAGPVSARG